MEPIDKENDLFQSLKDGDVKELEESPQRSISESDSIKKHSESENEKHDDGYDEHDDCEFNFPEAGASSDIHTKCVKRKIDKETRKQMEEGTGIKINLGYLG